MKVKIELDEKTIVEMDDREIISSLTLNVRDVNQLIYELESKVNSLYLYKSGIRMGKKNITDHITYDGVYTRHGNICGDD
ncbi:hypothetical protein F0919_00790 [Taibaiella lutea]|uniref:Uncharacterized protein n=1 Tax=Taibaiella lutea TaxID=2608001 RepID=A0A5M6CT84_9BACT|nr:hypothetical protein [Taibaiella lutea]KAA5536235.1 hypothetical protein F0919_00790 [Taibaiella lutea]